EFRIGSYGLLRGRTALSYERFQIAEVHDDRIVTVANLAATWPRGTRVEPLIRGRMTDQTDVTARGSRASETQCVFEATHEQPYDEGVDSLDQFLGMGVLAMEPNRSEDVTQAFQWAFSESDSLTGRRYRKSDTQRAIVHQKHSWFLKGRTAKAAFRSMLYRLRGAAKPIWLPTFNEDMTISRPITLGASSIYVKAFGYAYTGGATSGRNRIMIRLRDGTRLYRSVTGTAASGSATEERLLVSPPFPADLSLKQIVSVSWIDASRFENDRVELNHVNAADGVTTVSGIFQTFRNERVAPEILSAPIPGATKGATPCGTDVPENPDTCVPPTREGHLTHIEWFHKIPCNQNYTPYRNLTMGGNWQPNAPHGRAFYQFNGLGPNVGTNGFAQYEFDDYINPSSPHYLDPAYSALQGQLLIQGLITNQTVQLDFIGATHVPEGVWQLQVQYPAFYCGSVGLDGGDVAVRYCKADPEHPACLPTEQDLGYIGGNYPYTYSWEF
ncbi:MAG: hypothetical protein K2Q20_05585, partial [Phycisphaerales bacterium]|nr:hypothetical protein [Phycisphaerales bacterium]